MATVTFGIRANVDFDGEYNVVTSDGPQPSIETPTPHLTRCIVAFFQEDVGEYVELSAMRKTYTSDAGYESTGLTARIQIPDGQTYSVVVYMDNNKDYIDATKLTEITLERTGYHLDGDPQIFSSDRVDVTATTDMSIGVTLLMRYCRISFIDTNPTSKIVDKAYFMNGGTPSTFNAFSGKIIDAYSDIYFTNTSVNILMGTSMPISKQTFVLQSYTSSGELAKNKIVPNVPTSRQFWTKIYWSSAAQKSVDLTTLAGWSGLVAGTHAVTVVAKANGYVDSEPSAAVVVSKAASTVTLEAGTYIFKEQPSLSALIDIEQAITGTINTLAANNTYGSQKTVDTIIILRSNTAELGLLTITNNDHGYAIQTDADVWKYIDENGEFTSTDTTKLRTIIFENDQQVSPEFYKWTIADGNLVKYDEPASGGGDLVMAKGDQYLFSMNESSDIDVLSGSFVGTPTFYTTNNNANTIHLKPKGYDLIAKINDGNNTNPPTANEFFTAFGITATNKETSLVQRRGDFITTFSSRLSTTEGTDGGEFSNWGLNHCDNIKDLEQENLLLVVYDSLTDTAQAFELDDYDPRYGTFTTSAVVGYNTMAAFVELEPNPDIAS